MIHQASALALKSLPSSTNIAAADADADTDANVDNDAAKYFGSQRSNSIACGNYNEGGRTTGGENIRRRKNAKKTKSCFLRSR